MYNHLNSSSSCKKNKHLGWSIEQECSKLPQYTDYGQFIVPSHASATAPIHVNSSPKKQHPKSRVFTFTDFSFQLLSLKAQKDFRSIQVSTILYSSLVDSHYLNDFSYLPVHTPIMDLPTLNMYDESVTFLQDRLPDQLRRPQVAIICGSGLGLLAETVEHNGKLSMSFDYASVPHFPRSTGMTPYPRSTLFAPHPTKYLVL